MLDLEARKMPHDVATQWNSTFDMLAFAVQYCSTIDDITGDKSTNLRRFELDDNEWEIASQLHSTLKVHGFHFWNPHCSLIVLVSTQIFKDATLFFSRSTPSLVTVIPAMDHIDETMTDNSLDLKFEPSIRATLGIAKKTLNRYYNATDQSEVYHIAMGMCCVLSGMFALTILLQSSLTSSPQAQVLRARWVGTGLD
jgi:hypothetical protein